MAGGEKAREEAEMLLDLPTGGHRLCWERAHLLVLWFEGDSYSNYSHSVAIRMDALMHHITDSR